MLDNHQRNAVWLSLPLSKIELCNITYIDSKGLKMKIKWDAAAVITGLVAIIGGAIWLGNLQSDISKLDPKAIRAEIEKVKRENSTIPVGTVLMFWGDSAPSGYEICDGSVIQDRDSVLFDKRKPNFNKRFPLMQENFGGYDIGGEKEIMLQESNLPPHVHPNPGIGAGAWKIEKKDNYFKNYLEQNDKHKSNSDLDVQASDKMRSEAISILPPYQTVTCLIKVR